MIAQEVRQTGARVVLVVAIVAGVLVGAATPVAAQSGGAEGGGDWFGGFEWDFSEWFGEWLCEVFGTCEDPAVTAIGIEVGNESLTVGETASVTVTAEYDDGSTETVTENANLSSSNSSVVSIDGSTAKAVGPGSATLTASSEGASETANVSVDSPPESPDFQLTDVSTDGPRNSDPTAYVSVTVENRGGRGSQLLTVDAGPLGFRGSPLSLGPGERTTRTLSFSTENVGPGTYDVIVSSANDTDTVRLSIDETDVSDVLIADSWSNTPLTEGQAATVTVSPHANGPFGATTNVTLDAGSLGSASEQMSVGFFGYAPKVLTIPTEAGDAGTYTATIEADEVSRSFDLTVEPADPVDETFAATVADGYVEFGVNDSRIEFPECEDGTGPNASVDCVTMVGRYDHEADRFRVQPQNVAVPTRTLHTPGKPTASVEIDPSGPITGTIDPESGNATLSATLNVIVTEFDDTPMACPVELPVSATTGRSGNLTGVAESGSGTGTTEPTLVDGTARVPETPMTDAVCEGLDQQLGLPADPGETEFVAELRVEFEQPGAADPTDG